MVDLLASFRLQYGINQGPPGLTIMRIRGILYATGVSGAPFLTWAVRVADISEVLNFASLTTAQKNNLGPGSDQYADWMAWQTIMPNHGADPTTGVPNAGTYEVDVRSMRKLDELGQTLVFVAQKIGSPTPTLFQSTNVLLALP